MGGEGRERWNEGVMGRGGGAFGAKEEGGSAMEKRERDQDHDYGDVNAPIYCPDQPIQTSSFYANGVKLQSPASRSARWVTDRPND